MAATALIKFSQGMTVGTAGVALLGATDTAVSIANNSTTDIQSWAIECLWVPTGSTVPVTTLAFSNSGNTPAATFTPNVTGSYRIRLKVWNVTNRIGDPTDTDIRVFAIKETNNYICPPYQVYPPQLPPTASGLPGAKPDEMNFSGQLNGWAGTGSDGLLNDLIKHAASGIQSLTAGTGISLSGPTATPTITNTGIRTITAGSGISITGTSTDKVITATAAPGTPTLSASYLTGTTDADQTLPLDDAHSPGGKGLVINSTQVGYTGTYALSMTQPDLVGSSETYSPSIKAKRVGGLLYSGAHSPDTDITWELLMELVGGEGQQLAFNIKATDIDSHTWDAFQSLTDGTTSISDNTGASITIAAGLVETRTDTSNIAFSFGGGAPLGSGVGVIGISNCSVVPSGTPLNGGVLYVQNGVLKFLTGISGAVTTIAPSYSFNRHIIFFGAFPIPSGTPMWVLDSNSDSTALAGGLTSASGAEFYVGQTLTRYRANYIATGRSVPSSNLSINLTKNGAVVAPLFTTSGSGSGGPSGTVTGSASFAIGDTWGINMTYPGTGSASVSFNLEISVYYA